MSLFKQPSELQVESTVKVLIYGQPGLGKSSLALSAPAPVLLDFDGGIKRVNGAFHVPTLQVDNWEMVIEAMKEDLSPFQTIIIDTAGKMLDYMSAYIIKNDSKLAMRDGSLSLKGYGARKQLFIDFLSRCGQMKKHLIFVAHEREERDGETRIVRPEIGGSSSGDLIKELDLVGYMQAVGKDRTVFWTPQEKFYAKNTCNLPEAMKIPVIIDERGQITGRNTFLTDVFAAYRDYLTRQDAIKADYAGLLDIIGENVERITDQKTANEARKSIESFAHIWDSRLKAGLMLNEKCASLGLKFNKKTKQYEPAA